MLDPCLVFLDLNPHQAWIHHTVNQCCFNIGPGLQTVGQHQISIGSIYSGTPHLLPPARHPPRPAAQYDENKKNGNFPKIDEC